MGKRDYMENKGESRQAKIFTEKKCRILFG
jgi:hypothetical protein